MPDQDSFDELTPGSFHATTQMGTDGKPRSRCRAKDTDRTTLEIKVMTTQVQDAADQLRVVLESSPVEAVVAAAGSGAPQRILIVPWGEVRSDAGSFVMDDGAADSAIAAFTEHGTDLPIDYEHQTLGGAYSSPTGQAPAAGWVTSLAKVSPSDAGRDGAPAEPGLWGNVSWTGDGAERLASRQYRYLSPVALVRKRDRRLVGLHSAALTNKPAIVGMRPIVNRAADGAAATSGDAGDSAASEVHLSALRIALALEPTAEAALVLRSAVSRIRELETAERRRGAEDRVAAAMSEGKLAVSQRDWAIALALRDPMEFERWAADAPVIVLPGRIDPPTGHAAGDASAAVHRAAEASAREEWRSHRAFLEKLCGEEAYVACALRHPVAS